ncbi:MAG: flagellar hook-basal body complex protein [Polyangiaceae bacterium]
MATGIWSAASGAVAQSFSLDVAANNVANAGTPGFRADRAVFRQELARATARGEARGLRYNLTRTAAPSFVPGELVSTGRPLDVALRSENSLFAVRSADGVRYTRAGSLTLSADGKLTTPEGLPYRRRRTTAERAERAKSVGESRGTDPGGRRGKRLEV